jgi:ankyrin repeat protein
MYFCLFAKYLTHIYYSSPLNNAFLFGTADIIRILLRAGADLDYVNSRAWTSLSYLWDPEFENHPTTSEILDICFEQEFSNWNYKDTLGWGPIHRAAAFGKGRDIQNLMFRGASKDLSTTDRHWTPIHCAVMYGNESTFEVLVQQMNPYILTQMKDSSGWGLLHLAAEQGSEKIMFQLIQLGADPDALTIPSSIAIPKGLEYKELRAETIAEHCGHRQAYDNAMRAAFTTSVKIDN